MSAFKKIAGQSQEWPRMISIFMSSSRCIYENLALEEWLFRHHNLAERGDALLIWRNSPTVVFGRYQNPWLESNVCFCHENDIRLARRFSGGGAVYHDLGNLNISILTTHARHSRKRNLEAVARQLNAQLPLLSTSSRIAPNHRDDLVIEPAGSKISGTAARIAHGRAYHHFTLLVNANLEALRYALQSPLKKKIETNASRSTYAKSVGCLEQKVRSGAMPKDLMETVTECAMEAFESQYDRNEIVQWDGNHDKFPGMEEIQKLLRSEEWVFGKTPKFSLKLLDTHLEDTWRTIRVENGRVHESSNKEFPVGSFFHRSFLKSKYSELLKS